jgi:hypothetical protein
MNTNSAKGDLSLSAMRFGVQFLDSFVSIRVHSWLDRLFHMNTTIAEASCSSERVRRDFFAASKAMPLQRFVGVSRVEAIRLNS